MSFCIVLGYTAFCVTSSYKQKILQTASELIDKVLNVTLNSPEFSRISLFTVYDRLQFLLYFNVFAPLGSANYQGLHDCMIARISPVLIGVYWLALYKRIDR